MNKYLIYFLLIIAFIMSALLVYCDAILFLDGSRYYHQHTIWDQLFVSNPFLRYSTLLYQLPSFLIGKFLPDSLFFIKYYVYSVAYIFQPFLFLLINLKLIEKYSIKGLVFLPFLIFFVPQLTHLLFAQSIAIEASSYILPMALVLMNYKGRTWELFLFTFLSSLMAFGYETSIFPLFFFLIITFYKCLKKEKIYVKLLPTLTCSILIILYSSLFIIGTDSQDFTTFLSSFFEYRNLTRVILWSCFLLLILYSVLTQLKIKKIVIITLKLSLVLTVIYAFFDLCKESTVVNFDTTQNLDLLPNSTLLYDVFYSRILLIPLISIVIPYLYFIKRYSYKLKDGNFHSACLIMLTLASSILLSRSALFHKEGSDYIYNASLKTKGCHYESDLKVLAGLKYRGILGTFVPYYSVSLQKNKTISNILFTPIKGWGDNWSKLYKENICKTIDSKHQRATLLEQDNGHKIFFFLKSSILDFNKLFN